MAGGAETGIFATYGKFIAATLGVGISITLLLGLNRVKLNAYELQSVVETALVAAAMGLVGGAMNFLPGAQLPAQVFVTMSMVFILLSAGVRLILRKALHWVYTRGQPRKRVLIYGAGQTGQQLVAALNLDNMVEPFAFVDDNPTLQSLTVAGLKVHAASKIQELVAHNNVELVVLAMPSTSPHVRARIARDLREIGCEVHALPSFAELVVEGEIAKKAAPVEMASFLGRSRLEGELPRGLRRLSRPPHSDNRRRWVHRFRTLPADIGLCAGLCGAVRS